MQQTVVGHAQVVYGEIGGNVFVGGAQEPSQSGQLKLVGVAELGGTHRDLVGGHLHDRLGFPEIPLVEQQLLRTGGHEKIG